MKKFSAFLNEAEKSFAAKSAEKLNLKHIGYGRYADASGNVTHMSKDGKLVKLEPGSDTRRYRQQNGGEETADGNRVRSIKVQYLLHLEDLIHLLLGMNVS